MSSGSKKQITKAFKHLIQLYSSHSLEVVSVLVQLLLNGSDSKSYQVSHSTTHVQSLFDDWKPVVKKLSNKEPELLLNLIKAVLEKIETQEAMEYESVNAEDARHLDHHLKIMSRRSQMYEYDGDSSDDIPLPKRPKTRSNRTNGVDRISMLPDSLLIHILSFLPTIEDAIETGVLSKRWQYLWTSLPSLLFSYPDFGSDIYYDRLVEFARFVDKTLVLCNCSKLKKFMVQFDYDSRFASNVNLWIRFATRNATEKLQLYLYSGDEGLPEEDRFVLPQLFFTNSSLTELCFSYCTLVPKRAVDWKLLKKLSIGYVKLYDGVIQKILAGSPVLEILELYSFYGITHLHVTKPSLKKLILGEVWEYNEEEEEEEEEEVGIDNEHNYWLEISAPNLQSLEISGSLGRTNCHLADVSSLVNATLNCNFTSFVDDDDSHHDYEWYQNSLTGLLESLVHVKNLTLGSWALEVLSTMEMKGLRSPLSKCECLTINTSTEELVLPGIANILESCSHLETLVIAMSSSRVFECFQEYLTNLFNFSGELYLTSQKNAFKCLMMHLKIVKFDGSIWNYRDFPFSFVQFLLKNARVLQKMVINILHRIPQKEHFQIAQRFLSFPRSSPDAIIMFN
ncbi:putative F-box/LRR-repeat protein [Camellia lanceoleosa]|uniref:F-box/LRR-repeat protein n=1 Tax=Camellia lanceoleosa TaxID=1840588 RepID=A0ACC0I8E3_9ERIC|nr:putative F-box/LRR-repeat protein [Camellia lanceoleosa]